MIAGLWLLLQKTTLGRALRACAENPLAARLMGIDLPRMMLLSFALAALIGAAGGVLVAPIMSLQFDTGQFFTISGFVAVAIGGMASFAGSIVGGLLLGIAEQFAAFYVSSVFANTLALLLLLVVLILRPAGLFASGPARRSDVRDDARIHRAVVRLEGAAAIAFAIVLVGVLALLPLLPLPGGLLGSLVIALILFIAVLGLDVLMGYAGQVSLGHAGFMAVGGYAAAILATSYGWPPLAATLVALVLSVVCALVAVSRDAAPARALSRARDPRIRAPGRLARRRPGRSHGRTVGPRRHPGVRGRGLRVRYADPHVLSGARAVGRAGAAARRRHAARLRPGAARRCAPTSSRPPRSASMSAATR